MTNFVQCHMQQGDLDPDFAFVNNVPAPHFRHLISALSPVYWSVAREVDGAHNGFTLTGGDFNRESQVQYTTGG